MKKRKLLLLSLLSIVSLVSCDITIKESSQTSKSSTNVTSSTSESTEETSVSSESESNVESSASSTDINASSEKETSETTISSEEKVSSINTVSSEQSSSVESSTIPTPIFKALDFTKGKVKNVTELYYSKDSMPTTGSHNVLLIPVDFSDYDADTLDLPLSKLETAFNSGTRDELDYVNVSDYFYQSSYGQLDLHFDIYDSWVRASHPYSYYEKLSHPKDLWGSTGNRSSVTNEQVILHEVLTYLDNQGMDLSQYDSDKNGTIDSIVLIYSAPVEYTSQHPLSWAWKFTNYLADTSSTQLDRYYYDNVYAYDYLWASYQFLFDDNTAKFNNRTRMNTYTFIHEYSHVLGADDYYDTEYAEDINGDPLPAAQTLWTYDIMDASSGDHNPYTKFLYGWVTSSKLVTQETTITIKDFISSGETIILSNNWNDTNGMFQNYWLLSYYTNTGLNYDKDNSDIGLFSSNGLVTYLVDASITYQSQYKGYFLDNDNSYWIDQNDDGVCGTKNKLIKYVKTQDDHFLLKSDRVDSSNTTSKDSLGRKIPFKYEIVNEENGELTIKFTKNA